MTMNYLKIMIMIIAVGLTFQSCQDEELLSETTEEFRGGRNGGNNNNGNNNGGNNNGNGGNNGRGSSVASLDNDIVNERNELLLVLDRYAPGMRPTSTARSLAYINLAAYETAVVGMRDHVTATQFLDELVIDSDLAPDDIDYNLALNAAYSASIDHFIINLPSDQSSKIQALEDELQTKYSEDVDEDDIESSIEWGEYVAEQVISYALTDTEAESQINDPQPVSYVPPTGDGFWTYSAEPERALFPYWGKVRTFVISSDETSSVPPPISYSTLVGSDYYNEMYEVYEVNNTAREEQGEDLWIAEFWSDDVEALMMSPPGRQIAIADQLIDKYSLNLEESLTLFVKLGFSLNDAAVSAWADKYEHMVMRPSVYLREFVDPNYQTNLFRLVFWPNPSFPGYPSGHSAFASAASGVFIDFFGDRTNFTDRTHEGRVEFQSEPRSFRSFSDMAEENAFSRIPLGVHIRMDCTEGLRLGYEISDAVNDLNLNRRPG